MGSPVDDALDRLYVMADRAAGKDVRAADLAAITTVSKELEQLRAERDALQGRVYSLENSFPGDVRDEMEKGRYAVQRAKIAEAAVRRLTEGLRPFAKQPCGKFSPSWDGPEFVPCGECKTCIARALLSANPSDGEWENGVRAAFPWMHKQPDGGGAK